jgi:periplasmic protein TonB
VQTSDIEDEVRPDLGAKAMFSGVRTPDRAPVRRWSALCWGISCAVHLLLLVAVGVLTRQMIDVPPAPLIRVSILPVMGPNSQVLLTEVANAVPEARMPERSPRDEVWPQASRVDPDPAPTVTPPPLLPVPQQQERASALLTQETRSPALLEVMPEVTTDREPAPLIEPPRDMLLDRWASDAATSVVPMTPPVMPRALVPRPPQTSLARELPERGRSAAIFEDTVVARVPPAGQGRRYAPTAVAPETQVRVESTPQARLPRSTGARYGQNPTPSYPSEARRRGWEGTVLLLVEILENGRPERITIRQSSGHPILDEAAQGAVGRWMFIPAQREGKPVKSAAEVPIVFSLRKDR